MVYAIESRRRVKEQMNKRKSDDEFAKINLSYINTKGDEVIVYCPESRFALATQDPYRRNIHVDHDLSFGKQALSSTKENNNPVTIKEAVDNSAILSRGAEVQDADRLEDKVVEKCFEIRYGDTGYSYESIIGPYLKGVKSVEIDDPYIRSSHQVHNFVRLCEVFVKVPSIKKILLMTSYDEQTDVKEMSDRLGELKQSLLELDIALEVKVNENLHDCEIRLDNDWIIKIGRGLDFYQKPELSFGIGNNDLALRKCLETKVDIFQV